MRKIRRFNGEDKSEVSDENLNKLRQNQTERMARLARGERATDPKSAQGKALAELTPAAEPEASASRSMAPEKAAEAPTEPAAAAPKAKPAIVTLQQLNAFKAKYGADKELTDYMNQQQGLKRRNAPAPSAPAAAPKAEAKKTDTPVERGLPAKSSKEQSLAVAQIPLDDKRTPVKGESASGSELGRTVSNTLSALPISRGIQAAQSGAKLAGRKGVEEFVKRGEPIYREPKLEILKDISKPLALPKPTPRLGYDKAGAKAAERGGRAKGRQAEMLKENARRSGLREDASAETLKAVRDKLGGDKFTVKKHGGSVKGYASGGAVSASRRGDGIAQRGKTRGKMC